MLYKEFIFNITFHRSTYKVRITKMTISYMNSSNMRKSCTKFITKEYIRFCSDIVVHSKYRSKKHCIIT